jgi:hypothetical protein
MRGNFVIGAIVIVSPSGLTLSTSAEHAWRTLPLTSIVQAPQTSSRQHESQTTGATFLPSAVTGAFWISMSALMTFICGCHGTANSSQRRELFSAGPS